MVNQRGHVRGLAAIVALLALALGACAPQAWQTDTGDVKPLGTVTSALTQYIRERASAPDENPAQVYRPWVALVPTHDDSGFRRGVFDLNVGLPRMLAPLLAELDACRVVPQAAVEEAVSRRDHRWIKSHLQGLADTLQADFVVSSTLYTYKYERVHVGDPLIAGYKSYAGTVELAMELHSTRPLVSIGSIKAHEESRSRGLGLDLLGKPREGDRQFANLEQMTFGSEEFRATALGEATVLTLQQLAADLAGLLRPRELSDVEDEPRILSVFGEEVFINLGHAHGIQKGYRFTVSGGTRTDVPVVEVCDVISDTVSRVTVLRGADEIAPGQRLELISGETGKRE